MIKFIVTAFLTLSLVGSTQAQQLAALQPKPQGDVCAATIQSLTRDGGAALPVRGVVPNADKAMSGEERMFLLYRIDYGFIGPDPFWDADVFKKWEALANSGRATIVIANRSVLPKVSSGQWNQTIEWIDQGNLEKLDATIWFAQIVVNDGQGCQQMNISSAVFKENMDLPDEVWSMLNPKTPPKLHDPLLD